MKWLLIIPLLLAPWFFIPKQDPNLGAYTGERSFTLDHTIVKRIIYKDGMTEATIEFYGKNGQVITRTFPFTWADKALFQQYVSTEGAKIKLQNSL